MRPEARTAAVLVLCLAAVSIGAVALLGGGDERPEGFRPADEDPGRTVAAAAVTDAAARERPATAASERRGVAELDRVRADVGRDLPYAVVIDGATGDPVAGAEVFFAEDDDAEDARDADDADWLPDVALPERYGATRRTDAEGRAPLQRPRERLLVTARHGERFAAGELRPRSGDEVRLVLVRDETLHLLVLDAHGRPHEGAPLAVWCRLDERRADRLWRGESGEDGRAHIPHFQCLRPDNGDRFSALLSFPCPTMTLVEFPSDPVPVAPVVVRMPTIGAVEIAIVDPDGTPLIAEATISLRAAGRERDWLYDRSDAAWVRKEAGEPFARVERVAVGTPLTASVRVEGPRGLWEQRAEFPGPAFEGDVARVELSPPDWLTVIRGRVIDPDGAPLARSRFRAIVDTSRGDLVDERLHTTEEGRFELAFRLDPRRRPTALALHESNDASRPSSARVELPALEAGARVDLGDVPMTRLEPIVAGRVVDDLGAPIAEAAVRLERSDGPERARWRALDVSSVETAEDGTFTLFDVPGTDVAMRVRASKRDHVTTRSEPFTGKTRLPDLVLVRTADLEATVLVPEWLPQRALSASLMRPGQRRAVEREDIIASGGVGRLSMRRVPPGTYELRIDVRNHPEAAVVLSDVEVHPDLEERDPRLHPIDLRDTLHLFQVRAVGPDRQPLGNVEGAVVGHVRKSDGTTEHVGLQWRDGRARFIGTSPTAEVFALGMGRRPAHAVLAPGENDLVLHPLQPVEIQMPGVRAAVGEGRRVRVSLVLVGETGLPTSLRGVDAWSGRRYSFERRLLGKSGGAWLGDGDSVRMDLQHNGRYEVVLRLYEEGVRGPASRVIDTVDVRLDGAEPGKVIARVDRTAVQSAILELRERAER